LYYYILDYIQNPKFINFQKNLRQILTNLNISGEMAVSSPARGVEEIAELALERGYTTIVGVGGDLLVNRIANVLAGSQAALGVIPYDLSQEVADIFCGQDVKTACQGLRQRKTAMIDLGFIQPNKYFLSDFSIHTEKPARLKMEVDGEYALTAHIFDLNITRDLKTEFLTEQVQASTSWWSKKKINDSAITRLQAQKSIHLHTASPISVCINSDFEIVKTPIQISRAEGVLKIIVNRDTIN
jgi:diacylglycerol kinase family enzyme